MRTLLIALSLLVAGSASAASLRIKNGSTVRVAISGRRLPGVGVRAESRGWRLALAQVEGVDAAEVVDVTDGAAPMKFVVDVEDGALFLDTGRFVPGHAYRVELRKGGGSVLVYLYPPRPTKGRDRIVFDEVAPEPREGILDGIEIAPKGAL